MDKGTGPPKDDCEQRFAAHQPVSAGLEGGSSTTVRIWLFGKLASLISERPLELALPEPPCAADVISEIGRRIGPAFTEQVMETPDSLYRYCRVFADGLPIEDIYTPIDIEGSSTEFEMILMIAYEGG